MAKIFGSLGFTHNLHLHGFFKDVSTTVSKGPFTKTKTPSQPYYSTVYNGENRPSLNEVCDITKFAPPPEHDHIPQFSNKTTQTHLQLISKKTGKIFGHEVKIFGHQFREDKTYKLQYSNAYMSKLTDPNFFPPQTGLTVDSNAHLQDVGHLKGALHAAHIYLGKDDMELPSQLGAIRSGPNVPTSPYSKVPAQMVGSDMSILTNALSAACKDKPNPAVAAARGLACLRNINLLESINNPAAATAAAINTKCSQDRASAITQAATDAIAAVTALSIPGLNAAEVRNAANEAASFVARGGKPSEIVQAARNQLVTGGAATDFKRAAETIAKVAQEKFIRKTLDCPSAGHHRTETRANVSNAALAAVNALNIPGLDPRELTAAANAAAAAATSTPPGNSNQIYHSARNLLTQPLGAGASIDRAALTIATTAQKSHVVYEFQDEDLDCAWRIAAALENGSLPMLQKLTVQPNLGQNTDATVQTEINEKLHVYLRGIAAYGEQKKAARTPIRLDPRSLFTGGGMMAEAITATTGAPGAGNTAMPAFDSASAPGGRPVLTQRQLQDAADGDPTAVVPARLNLLESGLLAAKDYLDQAVAHATAANGANRAPFKPVKNGGHNNFNLIHSKTYTEERTDPVTGERSLFSKMDKRMRDANKWLEATFIRDKKKSKAKNIAGQAFWPQHISSPMAAHYRTDPEDYYRNIYHSPVNDARIFKEAMMTTVEKAIKLYGSIDYNGRRQALTIPNAANPNQRVPADPRGRDLTNLVRLAILEQLKAADYGVVETVPLQEFRRLKPLPDEGVFRAKQRLYSWLEGGKEGQDATTIDEIEQMLAPVDKAPDTKTSKYIGALPFEEDMAYRGNTKNQNSSLTPDLLFRWAGDVRGPNTAAAAIARAPTEGVIPDAPASADHPDWALFGVGALRIIGSEIRYPKSPNRRAIAATEGTPDAAGAHTFTKDDVKEKYVYEMADYLDKYLGGDDINNAELGSTLRWETSSKIGGNLTGAISVATEVTTNGLLMATVGASTWGMVRPTIGFQGEYTNSKVLEVNNPTSGAGAFFGTSNGTRVQGSFSTTVGPGVVGTTIKEKQTTIGLAAKGKAAYTYKRKWYKGLQLRDPARVYKGSNYDKEAAKHVSGATSSILRPALTTGQELADFITRMQRHIDPTYSADPANGGLNAITTALGGGGPLNLANLKNAAGGALNRAAAASRTARRTNPAADIEREISSIKAAKWIIQAVEDFENLPPDPFERKSALRRFAHRYNLSVGWANNTMAEHRETVGFGTGLGLKWRGLGASIEALNFRPVDIKQSWKDWDEEGGYAPATKRIKNKATVTMSASVLQSTFQTLIESGAIRGQDVLTGLPMLSEILSAEKTFFKADWTTEDTLPEIDGEIASFSWRTVSYATGAGFLAQIGKRLHDIAQYKAEFIGKAKMHPPPESGRHRVQIQQDDGTRKILEGIEALEYEHKKLCETLAEWMAGMERKDPKDPTSPFVFKGPKSTHGFAHYELINENARLALTKLQTLARTTPDLKEKRDCLKRMEKIRANPDSWDFFAFIRVNTESVEEETTTVPGFLPGVMQSGTTKVFSTDLDWA